MTGESTYGPLAGGHACRVPLVLAQRSRVQVVCRLTWRFRLLDGDAPVLEALGNSVPFEIAIGATL